MKASQAKKAVPNSRGAGASTLALRWGAGLVAVLWWLALKSYASRWLTLLQPSATAVVSPALEPLAPLTWPAWLASVACLAGILGLSQAVWTKRRVPSAAERAQWLQGVACLAIASAAWLIDLVIHWQVPVALGPARGIWGPSLWQPLWHAAFTGLAVERWTRGLKLDASQLDSSQRDKMQRGSTQLGSRDRSRLWSGLVWGATLACGCWWFAQSQLAYASFMLGFNDCGHFAQRVANTAAGRGWLLETPVLPAFWDHFNPGLTLLVPLWWIWPSMQLIFLVQAAALAGCAPLVMAVARRFGAGPPAAALWALAWLAQPILGQMNLAYTYGWHPISLAIAPLIACLVAVLDRRLGRAAVWALLASSFEEGVLVIIATTAATLAAVELWASRSRAADWAVRRLSGQLSARGWIAIAATATFAFAVIFRTSGLAEFQTGRFHTLGNSAWEVLLSPALRPQVFWPQLLRDRNWIFLAGLLVPCYLPAIVRCWPLLLPIGLPLGVLLVWDHMPAQSLAFHYPSTLLPVLWLAAIAGASGLGHRQPYAVAALATCLVAGFSLGQMPWSTNTLSDVQARTYGADSPLARRLGAADNRLAQEQLGEIRTRSERVLATGRLATHLVGAADLETVGQFLERRQRLAELEPGVDPLLRYDVLIFDRLEDFQQRPEQTRQLEQEALALGFRAVADQYEIVVLRRD